MTDLNLRFNTLSFDGIRSLVEADVLVDIDAKASKAANLSDLASAATARTNLGATATGSSLFTAASASAARTTLGAGATGATLFSAATAASARATLDLTSVYGGLYGDTTTQAIDTNLDGAVVPADIGQIFIGNTVASADAITIDANTFPGGVAFRRFSGTPATPLPATAGGLQLGYLDFRALNDTGVGVLQQFYNVASLDVVVDAGLPVVDGEPPRTRMRFFTCYNNDQAQLAMEIVGHGNEDGQGLYIGNLDTDGATGFSPLAGAFPRLYAVTAKDAWAAIVDTRHTAGASAALRIDSQRANRADYLLGGFSGVGGAYSEKVSIRADGSVLISEGVFRLGTTIDPPFGATKFHAESTGPDFAMSVSALPASGAALAARFHTKGETDASVIVGCSSGAGSGTFKLEVRGNGDVYRESTKILGAQGAAVADATDNATAITQLNALLARMRAHGLIAT